MADDGLINDTRDETDERPAPVRERGGDVRDVPAAILADAAAIEAEHRAAPAPLPEPPVEPRPLDPGRPIVEVEPDAVAVLVDRDEDVWVRTSSAADALWQCVGGPMHSWAQLVELYGPLQLVADAVPSHRREHLGELATVVDNPGTALQAAVALLRPADPARSSRADVDRLLVAVRRAARVFERHLERDRSGPDDELSPVPDPGHVAALERIAATELAFPAEVHPDAHAVIRQLEHVVNVARAALS